MSSSLKLVAAHITGRVSPSFSSTHLLLDPISMNKFFELGVGNGLDHEMTGYACLSWMTSDYLYRNDLDATAKVAPIER
jgi:hypothetical protein